MQTDKMTSNQLSMFEEPAAPLQPVAKATTIKLSKTINAPSQQVFDHWLIPVFIGDWMFAAHTQQGKVISLENKVRKGGAFRFTIDFKGSEIIHNGEYLELDIPNKLAFTWRSSTQPDCESKVTAQFQEVDNKTRLKLTIRLAAELYDQKDLVKQAWTSRCSALAAKFKK
ncbi:MAG: SRPBCC family protein [Gammaproteobacteria bacterium]|jgi:uncharacterized protein YndB with AHSA1/START domain|nr:SRPBCC family protein [Gammaproteobacteria bacterium]MDP6733517.1 SRPBCC family protein [Gammaproteobacteria bacterium]|tara:strand:+ start:149 stop:658 length:510 start_codon:yes stop_codon:yes gene_type:complete